MKTRKVVLFILGLSFIALTACIALFFGSSGCASSGALGTGEHILASNGIERSYYLKLPADYNDQTAYPLIFAFHGLGGDSL
jgi:poly(3-hydroxybutyrate) depolymerase